jgi:hypothetical protein
MILTVNRDYFLKSINQLILEMEMFGVLFDIQAEFLMLFRQASASKI